MHMQLYSSNDVAQGTGAIAPLAETWAALAHSQATLLLLCAHRSRNRAQELADASVQEGSILQEFATQQEVSTAAKWQSSNKRGWQ
jgi:hypothetical protein